MTGTNTGHTGSITNLFLEEARQGYAGLLLSDGLGNTNKGDFDIDLTSPADSLRAIMHVRSNLAVGSETSPYSFGTVELNNFREEVAKKRDSARQLLQALARQQFADHIKILEDLRDRFAKRIDEMDQLLGAIQGRQKALTALKGISPELLLQAIDKGDYTSLLNAGFTQKDITILESMKNTNPGNRLDYIYGQVAEKQQTYAQAEEKVSDYRADLKSWVEALDQEIDNFDGKLSHPKLREIAIELKLDPDNISQQDLETKVTARLNDILNKSPIEGKVANDFTAENTSKTSPDTKTEAGHKPAVQEQPSLLDPNQFQ